jgi:hypothetical protein
MEPSDNTAAYDYREFIEAHSIEAHEDEDAEASLSVLAQAAGNRQETAE